MLLRLRDKKVYVHLTGLRGPAPRFFMEEPLDDLPHENGTASLLLNLVSPSDIAYDIGAHIRLVTALATGASSSACV